jgi:hypothetical protein
MAFTVNANFRWICCSLFFVNTRAKDALQKLTSVDDFSLDREPNLSRSLRPFQSATTTRANAPADIRIRMTLYGSVGCDDDPAVVFETPVGICFNPRRAFPNGDDDKIWGDWDVLDTLVGELEMQRVFYPSTDGSCEGDPTNDSFAIPLNVCVGPFGPPYPWGVFQAMPGGVAAWE